MKRRKQASGVVETGDEWLVGKPGGKVQQEIKPDAILPVYKLELQMNQINYKWLNMNESEH